MTRFCRASLSVLFFFFLLSLFTASELLAFSTSASRLFHREPLAFRIEISLSGDGNLKKPKPLSISSLKIKVKNEKASPEALKVKAIRIYTTPGVFRDVETQEFSISPGQWVTRHFRMRKPVQPVLGEKGYVEVVFEKFSIQFYPREKKFQGPV